jgi:signal transduction histidine kinase
MFSFFSLVYFPAQQANALLDNYNNEVQNLANTISLGVRIALTEENFEGVQTAMSFVKDDPRLRYVNLLVTDSVWNEDKGYYVVRDSILTTFPEGIVSENFDSASHIRKRSAFSTDIMTGAIELAVTTDAISQGKQDIRRTSIMVSAIFLGIGIIIGFWLSRTISVPVLALRDAANKVGDGDLTQRVTNTSNDEIGELASAFNNMVVDLAKAREELREANITLGSTNEQLQATVEDLKATQEQLVQSEKMASLGQLTAGIAHEINNPINFVTANIQPLKEDLQDILRVLGRYDDLVREKGLQNEFKEIEALKQEAQIDYTLKEVTDLLRGIEDGATRTSEIVKGLRNFSRLDQNVYRKANLNESLESTLTLLHSSYKNRIEIVREFGQLQEVDCYPGKINQVFMNLLSNAIQAIPEQGKIFITTSQLEDCVRISIRDTGTGMSDDVRKKIFDPFFTTKDVGKGTGLGLSISFGILQKHRGDIDVFSEVGKGTEFVITIPVTQEAT